MRPFHKYIVQYRRLLGGMLACYGILLFTATACMIAAARLPHDAIAQNCSISVNQLQRRGDGAEVAGCPLLRFDTFTDMIMLNVACSMTSQTPVASAMRCRFFTNEAKDVFATTPLLVAERFDHPDCYFLDYGRYWHGYLMTLRPLLAFFTYNEICLINLCAHVILLLLSLILVWTRCSSRAAVCLLMALTFAAFPMAFFCLQFSTCFLLMYAGTVAVLARRLTTRQAAYIFFVIGAATSFFDLLTTPQITMGIPLATLLLSDKSKADIRHTVILASCWLAGYALMWLGKLPVAWLLIGDNIAGEFITNAIGRSSAGLSELFELAGAKLGPKAATIIGFIILVGTAGLLTTCHWLWKYIRLHPFPADRRPWLLLIALSVPCWYMLMLQHSVIHYWFTWRALAVTVFCLLLFYPDRIKKTVSKSQGAR